MKKIFQYILMAVAVVVTASCSNELDDTLQPANNGTLQFVVSDFPAFGEGTQTRVIGTQDEGKTAWENGDQIIVILITPTYGEQAVALTYDGSSWSTEASLSYLENETPTVSVFYAPCYEVTEEGVMQLRSGMQPGMTEYLYGNYEIENGIMTITFEGVERNYSRLRIAGLANQVMTVTTTDFTPAGTYSVPTEPYTLTADENGNAFLYGTFDKGATVTVKNGDTELATHTFDVATKAEKSYALYAGKKVDVDLSTCTATYVINDDAYYTFTGTGSHGIKVESGNPTIILNNAIITVGEGSAIDIASGSTTTIQVLDDNTISTSKTDFDETDATSGGIFVAEGGTVNITSNGTDNVLRARGNDAAAIGGKYVYNGESYNAGSINISNVTVYAYTNDYFAAAIGAAGEGTCGTINITNAVVYAYGGGDDWTSAPGIGSAMIINGWPETTPVVIISDSEIHTFRFNQYSDYIGYLGDELGEKAGYHATGGINCGEGGSVKSSTIYCYTGLDATTTDKVVTYDADGNPTEQVAE